jgi:hypothetical protein
MKYYKKPLPRFHDPAVWAELKRQCYNGTIDYEEFPADEYKYFDRLRIIYLEFKFAGMPKDAAAEAERLLLAEYTASKEHDRRSLDIFRRYLRNKLRFRESMIKINRSSVPAEKYVAALAAISAATNDELFARINAEGDETK